MSSHRPPVSSQRPCGEMKTRFPARAPVGVLSVCLLLVLLSDRVHAAARSASATNSLISRRHGSSSFSLSDVPHKENSLLKGPRTMPFQDGLSPGGGAFEEEQETKSHRIPPEARARWRSSSSMGALHLTDKITPRSFMAGSLFATAILLLMGLGSNANLIPKESFGGHDEGSIQQKNSDASVMAGLSSSSRNKLLLGGVGLLFLLASSLAVPAPTQEPPSPPVTLVPVGENRHKEVVRIGQGWKNEHGASKQGETLISLTFNGQMYELYLPKSTEDELKDKPEQLEALKKALSSNAQLSWADTTQPGEPSSSYYWEWGWTPRAELLHDSDDRWPGVRFVFYIPEDVSKTFHPGSGSMTQGCQDLVALVETLAQQVHTPTAIPGNVVKTWEGAKPQHKSTEVPVQDYLDKSGAHKTCVVGRGWQDGTKTQRTRPAVPFYGFQDGQNAIQFKMNKENDNTVDFKVILTRSMEKALGEKNLLQKFVASLSSPPQDVQNEQDLIFPEKQSGEERQVLTFTEGDALFTVQLPDESELGPLRRWGNTSHPDARVWAFQAGKATYHVYMPRDACDALEADKEAWTHAAYLINAAVLKLEAEQPKN